MKTFRHSASLPLLAVAVLAALGAAGRGRAGAGVPGPSVPRPAAAVSSAFRLSSALEVLVLDANRVQCAINAIGRHCTDPDGNTSGGGFWPAGTSDQYIFGGGLQIAAIIQGDRASFGWAGDTVGAFFFDAAGFPTAGTALTHVFNSRNPSDLADWPSAAYVRDTALFDVSLIGRKAASEQDSWVRYWEGDPRTVYGRTHPMGLLVDQRTLAWNRPEAGRDILFVLLRLINVTARDRSRYAGLAAAGYAPEDIDEIARIGAAFHQTADSVGVSLPDTGFTWTNFYVGLGQDPDVTSGGGSDYSTVVLPFATAFAYKADFLAPYWTYPSDIFLPPFATAPGLVGTKFLRAPRGAVTGTSDVRMFTNFSGGGIFPSPLNMVRLWRMMANHILPIDGSCNAPQWAPACYLAQGATDTRWHMSSGPWPDVGGGQSVAFAIAYVFAAPLAAALQNDGRGQLFGSAFFDLKPGIPGTGPRLAAGTDTVRQIERVAGWASFADANGNGDIEQSDVRVQPYSLLGKAAAQSIADHKFVLASPPAAPRFFLLAGDGQVTVVWERSATDVTGDPYFPVASNPLSGVYDPNFRQFDVEGYRVWRGRSLASLQLVAQFDYARTTLTDRSGQVFAGAPPSTCAPELGIVAGCGADFLHGGTWDVPLAGTVVQVPPGGRALVGAGAVATFRTDTAVTGGRSGLPPLRDTGVPFAFVDAGLQNATSYVYAVTAFDVNSINSGPTSLESDVAVLTVTPRIASSNARAAVVEVRVEGGDGSRLDPTTPFPAIDANDGTFSGPIPPVNGGRIDLPGLAQELLPTGTFTLVVDSVSPGFAAGSAAPYPSVFFSVLGGMTTLRGSVLVNATGFMDAAFTTPYEYVGPFVPYDSSQAGRFGARFGPDARMVVRFTGLATGLGASSPGAARAGERYFNSASRFLSHSRWYDEGSREPHDPTITPFASASHTNGALTGVAAIFSPLPYRLPIGAGAPQRIPSSYRSFLNATLTAWYPADIVVRWGNGGEVALTDLTHKTTVPYKRAIQPGYGFLNASAVVAAGATSANLNDGASGVTFDPSVVSYYSLRTIRPVCSVPGSTVPCAPLQPSAQLQPVDVTNDGVADGTGVALVINGEPFFLLMSALPASGTAWHLRAVGGIGMSATCTPALPSGDVLPGSEPADCAGYAFVAPPTRPAYVPGLRFTFAVTRQFGADTSAYGDLSGIHTVPDPLYFTNAPSVGALPSIRFVNLPERAVIRIYSSSGILVTVLTHDDPTAGGELVWAVTNRSGRYVASGVYFYHVETPDHHVKIGRFTVVQQAWP